MRFPSIKAVRKELVKKHKHLRQLYPNRKLLHYGDNNFSGFDVRLQVSNWSGWCIHIGDATFDLSHSGYWGSSIMTWERENLEAIARSLVEQVKYHMQECAS